MQKIDIYIEVNNYKINNTGELNNQKISCLDNNDNKTIVSFDLTNNILTRDNDDITIYIDFDTEQIQYHLKKENKTAISSIKIKEIQKNNNSTKIVYTLEDNIFNLKIDYKIK